MILRATTAIAAVLLSITPVASQAALSGYTQNFETLTQSDPAALSNDGWVVYGNVYTPARVYIYGYGPFPAPNPGGGFCAIDAGQGGVSQGAQQLSVYSDYNNTDHASGRWIESNVYREQTIGAADVGKTWVFQFDAKLGNLTGSSTAIAFIKTLNPMNGYVTTHFHKIDMTAIPTSWARYEIRIPIHADLVGQLAQFGFANTATNYVASGVYYDNIQWFRQISTDVGDKPLSGSLELRAISPNPFRFSSRIEYSIAIESVTDLSVFDITGRRIATLFHGTAKPGQHVAIWDGRSTDGSLVSNGVYRCVLRTAVGRQERNIVLSR